MGLAISITCSILIMLFVKSEYSYDTFHTKADRLFRLSQHEHYEGQDFVNTVTPLSMGTVMQQTFEEIESTCRVFAMNRLVKVNQNSFSEDIRMVDSTFFQMFDFELTVGNINNPFPNINSVILTEELAVKYFGNTNPVGKSLLIELGDDKTPFIVSGIAKANPEESSIKFKMLISYANEKDLFGPNAANNWFNVFTETYVLLKENISPENLASKFEPMIKTQLGSDYKAGSFIIKLQPISDIHLDITMPFGNEPISDPKYAYILTTIGLLLIFVACINFITLSLGQSTSRSMEVGIRQVMGAGRQQLIQQFWGEALVITVISVIIGLLLSMLFLSSFNQLISRNLSLNFDLFFLSFCFGLVGFIALIAGGYPALILSGYKPMDVIKGKVGLIENKSFVRQSLVIGQFVASIAMIICTIIIGEQMNYIHTKDLGYNKEKIIIVPTNKPRREGFPLAQLYRAEITKHSAVLDAAVSLYSLGEPDWIFLGITDDKKVYHNFQCNSVSAEFVKTMGIQVKEGRDFSSNNTADIYGSALVNEAFLEEFNISDPIGKKLPGKFDQRIIGVLSDFNYQSLRTKIQPMMLVMQPDSVFRKTENISFNSPPQPRISIRMDGNISTNIEMLKKTWEAVVPNQEFEFSFLDESINSQYETEQRSETIVKIASGLSVFIACIGLFGLVALAVARRTKEIGIRKILGASVGNILYLISKEFVKLISIAAIIAFPIAWWFMNDWLSDFAYPIQIELWVFLVSGILVLLIALLTVNFQAIKAAMVNPVDSLKNN